MDNEKFPYDVALSFAGENRAYVEKVALFLKHSGIRVFYDLFEEANLWGKNLYSYLSEIYEKKAKYVVIFISEDYKQKLWTNHEREAAQARAFKEKKEYILPARFDDTEIPGIKETIGYININKKSPSDFGELLIKKLNLKDDKPRILDNSQQSIEVSIKSETFLKMLDEYYGPISQLELEWYSFGRCGRWDIQLSGINRRMKTEENVGYAITLWDPEFDDYAKEGEKISNYLGIQKHLEGVFNRQLQIDTSFMISTQEDNLIGERRIPSSSAYIYISYNKK